MCRVFSAVQRPWSEKNTPPARIYPEERGDLQDFRERGVGLHGGDFWVKQRANQVCPCKNDGVGRVYSDKYMLIYIMIHYIYVFLFEMVTF